MDCCLASFKLKRRYRANGMWRQCFCELAKSELIIKSISKERVEKTIKLNAFTELIYEHTKECREFAVKSDNEIVYFRADSPSTFEEWRYALRKMTFHDTKLTMDDFEIYSSIGSGYYGSVMLVQHKRSGMIYALKEMKKSFLIQEEKADSAKKERDILLMAHYPFVVSMYFAFQSKSKVYIGLEYLHGGQLFRLVQCRHRITVPQLCFYVAEIALALNYLHSIGIVYRDLKLENVLVCEDGHIKLSDFGLSKRIMDNEGVVTKTSTFCGTDEYIAPEMLKEEKYAFEIDWWELGVLMYELCFHITPFYADTVPKIQKNILTKEPAFPPGTPPYPMDLIRRLLNKDPKQRADFNTIVNHPLFKGVNWNEVEKKNYQPPFKPEEFNISQHTKKMRRDSTISVTCEGESEAFDNFSFSGDYFA